MLPASSSPNTSSGITTTPSGVRHVPSSTRADGSTRKEIKVRPGYRPPEDVEVYKNRTAEAWKTRGVGAGVPGAEGLKSSNGGDSQEPNAKNAKRREARKKAKASAGAHDGDEAADLNDEPRPKDLLEASSIKSSDLLRKGNSLEADPLSPPDPTAEREKQVRTLKKKLRQARELREKEDNGESLLPEQFEKVIKINELIRQLDGLGFNSDGEPKRD
jgi:partner of Y14 and mago protein